MSGFMKSLSHQNKLPGALAPKETKALQDIIANEKKLVEATFRLSTDRAKSSTAIREWGTAEGPDLGDILPKLSMLFDYLSTAEKACAEHDENFRLHFKEIRTREETFANLRKGKDTLANKIDSQERKVSKMKEENKDLPANLQRLAELRQEMIGLENSVMNEDSRLGDFKRITVRQAMSLKLGAILELAEKTVVVAELGKLLVEEIPAGRSEPGMPRGVYDGYQRTDELMQQAQKCIQDVVFNPQPLSGAEFDPQHQASHEEARNATKQVGYENDFNPNNRDGHGYEEGNYGHNPQHEAPQLAPIPSSGQGFYNSAHEQNDSPTNYSAQQNHYNQFSQPDALNHQNNRSSLAYDQPPSHATQPAGNNLNPVPEFAEESGESATERMERQQAEEMAKENGVDVIATENESNTAGNNPWQSEPVHNGHVLPVAAPISRDFGTGGIPYTAARNESGLYYPPVEAGQRPYIPKEGDGAYHGQHPSIAPPPTNSRPASFEKSDRNSLHKINTSAQNESAIPGAPTQLASAVPTSPAQISTPTTRKPIMIRGESALGSKHGDLFVPSRSAIDGVNAIEQRGGPSSAQPNNNNYNSTASGYYRTPDNNSEAGSDARKIPAGAFRRAGAGQGPSGPITNQFMNPTPNHQFNPSASEAMAIRDEYRAQSIQREQTPPQQIQSDVAPRFDVTPLNVGGNKGRQQLSRADSLPSESGHTIQPPPSYRAPTLNNPTSPMQTSASSGFGRQQFVTRLD